MPRCRTRGALGSSPSPWPGLAPPLLQGLANAASASSRKRSPSAATRASYHAAASAISVDAATRTSAMSRRQPSASLSEGVRRRDRLGSARSSAFDTGCHTRAARSSAGRARASTAMLRRNACQQFRVLIDLSSGLARQGRREIGAARNAESEGCGPELPARAATSRLTPRRKTPSRLSKRSLGERSALVDR
jgi:hypothetical protein